MKKILGLVLLGLFFLIPSSVKAQSATTQWNAVPLPGQPSITKLIPGSSYVTSAGFSQDGKTFVTSEKLQIIGTGFTASSTISFNGVLVTVVFVSATEVDITITQAMISVPTVSTQYAIVAANPVPVLN